MFVVHACPGQGVGVPWVKSSSSVHNPINSVSNFMMDVWTAIAEAAVAYEVPVDAAVDTTCAR